jgi:hypothetical protein
VVYTPDTSHPTTTYTSTYNYDQRGSLASAAIDDGTPRTIDYTTNLAGEILTSRNSKGPASDYYVFGGTQEGLVTNNGTTDPSYAQSITDQTTKPGTGYYANGATSGTNYAAFGTDTTQINGLGSSFTGASYTVQTGDSLESIAQAIWGDSSFWYLRRTDVERPHPRRHRPGQRVDQHRL